MTAIRTALSLVGLVREPPDNRHHLRNVGRHPHPLALGEPVHQRHLSRLHSKALELCQRQRFGNEPGKGRPKLFEQLGRSTPRSTVEGQAPAKHVGDCKKLASELREWVGALWKCTTTPWHLFIKVTSDPHGLLLGSRSVNDALPERSDKCDTCLANVRVYLAPPPARPFLVTRRKAARCLFCGSLKVPDEGVLERIRNTRETGESLPVDIVRVLLIGRVGREHARCMSHPCRTD
jgi:hypothetical protein